MTDLQISLLDPPTEAQQVMASAPGRSRRTNPATSRQAAVKVGLRAGALKHRILAHLAAQGDEGANDWELHVHCDPNGRVHSAATRRKELHDEFDPPLVRTTAVSRPTDDDDSEGLVHVLTERGRQVLAEIEEGRRGA